MNEALSIRLPSCIAVRGVSLFVVACSMLACSKTSLELSRVRHDALPDAAFDATSIDAQSDASFDAGRDVAISDGDVRDAEIVSDAHVDAAVHDAEVDAGMCLRTYCSISYSSSQDQVSGRDHDCDGSPDSHCWFSRQAPTARVFADDRDCDGVGDANCTEHNTLFRRDDADCDGVFNRCEAYESMDGVEITRIDEGCDGVNDVCTSAHYAVDGLGVSVTHDEGCDGMIERCTTRANADVFLTREISGTDTDCDGVNDMDCAEILRDPTGWTRLEGGDADCDGVLDQGCFAATGDYPDRVIFGTDDDCDGAPDRDCTQLLGVTPYDHWGNDSDCDGTIDPPCPPDD